ncbi:MAG: GlxA family transcriptional regulator [Planctomycetota bacterium]
MLKQEEKTERTHRRIVFLTFPDVVLLDLAGPWQAFALANRMAATDRPPYKLELVSGDESNSIDSMEGITLSSHRIAANCRGHIDTLVVPAANSDLDRPLLSKSSRVINRLAKRSRRVVSVCGGAFLLAEAGLLSGKKATTHWQAIDEFARRFPDVAVQSDSVFVRDGNVYTSAGVTTGIDLSLELIEEDLGQSVALSCARELVMFMRRPGGQSQFSVTLQSQRAARSTINELIAWVTDHPDADLSVEAMAERIHMSARNFSRVFRNEIGQTPAAFVEKLRVESARRRLEQTNETLDAIARECGFGSSDSMRRSFRRVVKVSPGDYRQRFSGP